jgi:hypothetical protein
MRRFYAYMVLPELGFTASRIAFDAVELNTCPQVVPRSFESTFDAVDVLRSDHEQCVARYSEQPPRPAHRSPRWHPRKPLHHGQPAAAPAHHADGTLKSAVGRALTGHGIRVTLNLLDQDHDSYVTCAEMEPRTSPTTEISPPAPNRRSPRSTATFAATPGSDSPAPVRIVRVLVFRSAAFPL